MNRFAAILAPLLSLPLQAATQLAAGSVTAAPGAQVTIPIVLQSDVPVAAFQLEILAAPATPAFASPLVTGAPASHLADGQVIAPGLVRVVSYSLFNTPLPNGTVLSLSATMPSTFSEPVTLSLTNAILSTAAGLPIAGVVLVPGSIRTSASGTVRIGSVTAANGSVRFEISGLSGPSFIVESSSNLSIWTTIATQPVSGATAIFSRPIGAGEPRQFYRVRLP